MTEKGFITANSGDTDVAGTLSIAAPRALYAVASGHKPKKNPEELLPASPADRGSGIRLIKSEDRKKDDIINRPGRSTYPREKSVLTSGATCHRRSVRSVRAAVDRMNFAGQIQIVSRPRTRRSILP